MQRLGDEFLKIIDNRLHLANKQVLEIGCGNGSRTVPLAKLCERLVAIDPDAKLIKLAEQTNTAENLTYKVAGAEALPFKDQLFDVVIFSLSLHHVPIESMSLAMEEAVRVLKVGGKMIFLEPAFEGSFFDAELAFSACDGDERKEKAAAYFAMLTSSLLFEDVEITSSVTFVFDSAQDFIENMEPRKDIENIAAFLSEHNNTLHAQRRINVFSVSK